MERDIWAKLVIFFTILGALAAALVVPEIREWIGLDAFFIKEIARERNLRILAEKNLNDARKKIESDNIARQRLENQVQNLQAEIERERAARKDVERQLLEKNEGLERVPNNTVIDGKEKTYLRLLDKALAERDENKVMAIFSELKQMNSMRACPKLVEIIKNCIKGAYAGDWNSDFAENVCRDCIATLATLNCSEACETLYEIRVESPTLQADAQAAIGKICK